MMVGLNESLTVGDHDFTKFGIILSVTLQCDIPEGVTESCVWWSSVRSHEGFCISAFISLATCL